MVRYKKIIFTLLCLVLLQISGSTQIKTYESLGLNIAALKITGVEEVTGYKHRLGKTFGIGFENKVSPKRYIQFELLYTTKGYKVYQPSDYLSIAYNYLQLQHNHQFNIYKNFHFNLGLYSAVLLSQSQEWFRFHKTLDTGLLIGLAFKVDGIQLSSFYSHGVISQIKDTGYMIHDRILQPSNKSIS